MRTIIEALDATLHTQKANADNLKLAINKLEVLAPHEKATLTMQLKAVRNLLSVAQCDLHTIASNYQIELD